MPSLYYSRKVTLKQTKKPKKRWIFLKVIMGVIFALGLFLVGVFAYFTSELPNPQEFGERIIEESTKIYDRTGKILLYEVGKDSEGKEVIKRTYVPLEKISPYLQKAVIVAEDRKFYHHPGVDFKGLTRAVINNITKGGKEIQGGSTITQQLIKNSLLTPERTIQRKIKEAIMALEMERRYSKEEILEFYLNQINFGSVFYGAESASQNYFGKSAHDLTLAEAATLASLIKAPTFYLKNPEAREERKNWILKEMTSAQMIEKEEAKNAQAEKTELQILPVNMKAPYFTQEVIKILEDLYGRDYGRIGLTVHTTLDLGLQKLGEKVVQEWQEKLSAWYGVENAALLAIDPRKGEILAMVGGRNFEETQVNIWVPETRQGFQSPGSAFKPIVYATAFMKGYSEDTILWDTKTNFSLGSKPYIPENFDRKERGPVTMKDALAQSLNIPAVKTLYLAGIEEVAETAKKMGMLDSFDKSLDPTEAGLSMAIGGKGVVPLELVSAFGVFAAEGKRYLPRFILKIEDKNGKIIYEPESYPIQALLPEIASKINWILSQNDLRSPMFGSNSWLNLGPQMAVKTGTAARKDGKITDSWTIGYTRNLVTGVWVGNNHNEPMRGQASGADAAAPLWHQFIKEATKNEPKISFLQPPKIKTGKAILDGYLPTKNVVIDALSQKLATPLTPAHLKENREYPMCHTILYWIIKDDPRGPYPKNPVLDPMFKNWEEGVQNWCQAAREKFIPPSETTPLHTEANIPQITLLSKEIKKEIGPLKSLDGGSSEENVSPEKDMALESKAIGVSFSIKVSAPLGIKKLEVFSQNSEKLLLALDWPAQTEFSFGFKVPNEIPNQDRYPFKVDVLDKAENKGTFEFTIEK